MPSQAVSKLHLAHLDDGLGVTPVVIRRPLRRDHPADVAQIGHDRRMRVPEIPGLARREQRELDGDQVRQIRVVHEVVVLGLDQLHECEQPCFRRGGVLDLGVWDLDGHHHEPGDEVRRPLVRRHEVPIL